MRTEIKEHEYYQFNELSEEAQQNAIERLYDINVDHEWWDFIYSDAYHVNFYIKYFDSYFRITEYGFQYEAIDTINAILKNHGSSTDTYKLAKEYAPKIKRLNALIEIFGSIEDDCDGYLDDKISDLEYDLEEISKDFRDELASEYSHILEKEYNHRTSREGIIETIEINELEFTKEGELI